MLLKGRNLVKSEDFSVEEIDQILSLSQNIIENPSKYSRVCEGKLLATLFYEPSTRTRLSFESAMCRLGGSVVGFSEPNSSSVSKGESLGDTIRTVSCYADAIVMRHPVAGSAEEATKYTEVPFINAGDGGKSTSNTNTYRSTYYKITKRKFRKSYNRIMWRLKKWKNSTFFSKIYV